MSIYLDEPLAIMAATALTVAGAVVGAWWQRRRTAPPQYLAARELDPRLIDARFDRLEQLVETTALEVERVSEGQRFTTKLLVERAGPSAPPTTPQGRPAEHRTPH